MSDRTKMLKEGFPLIVCLCGSTRFKEIFEHYNRTLTRDGHIVLSVGSYPHYDGDMKEIEVSGIKERLDNLHLRKIDLCDRVFVLNVGGYIGESTRREIEYAEKIGREVKYLEPKCKTFVKEDDNGQKNKD